VSPTGFEPVLLP